MTEEITVYENFTFKVEGTLAKRSELNDQINANRAAHAKALAEFDRATMRGDTDAATRAREECEKLDRDVQWLQRSLDLITRDGGRHDPDVVEAGRAVYNHNKPAMKELTTEFNNVTATLAETKTTYMTLVRKLGEIQRAGAKLRTQNAHVAEVLGNSLPWIEAPGDVTVNITRQKGIIYIDADEITRVYQGRKH